MAVYGVYGGGGYPKYRQAPDKIIYCYKVPITFNYRKYINSCIGLLLLHKYNTDTNTHNVIDRNVLINRNFITHL